MERNKMTVLTLISISFVILLVSIGCQSNDSTFQPFVMKDGLANFSFEYNSHFIITDSYTDPQLSSVDMNQINDKAHIIIAISPPDSMVPNAKAGIIRAEDNAASWPGYKLLSESELLIDNIKAYRFDSEQKDVAGILSGDSSKNASVVYREVRFDAKGLVWMIQIESPSDSAEADLPDFDHILQTFKILN